MCPALLRIWTVKFTCAIKFFNVFGMIIDEKFGIIIFFAQAPYILNSGQKNVKARSMTTLFQLMQTHEHKEKKRPCRYVAKANMDWILRKCITTIWLSARKKEKAGFPRQTMAGSELFFAEKGIQINNGWWNDDELSPLITVSLGGDPVKRALTATTEFLIWLHYNGKY